MTYIKKHSKNPSFLCKKIEDETCIQNLNPDELSGSEVGLILQLFAANANKVLEIGTLTGLGTLYIAEALPENATVYTIDNDFSGPKKDLALKYWNKSGLRSKITQYNVSASVAYTMFDKEFFDMVFIDGQSVQYQDYIDGILPLVRSRGIIVIDDVLDGDMAKPKSIKEKSVSTFNKKLAKDPRFMFVQILNIGEGITIAIKK